MATGWGRAVVPAPAHTEPVNRHILSCEHNRDGVTMRGQPGSELGQISRGERQAKREPGVNDLPAKGKPGGSVLVQGGGDPPRGNIRRSSRRGSRERRNKIRDNCLLRRGEVAVPEEVDGEVAGEERAVVVAESDGFWFDKVEGALGGGEGGNGEESEEEEEEERHC